MNLVLPELLRAKTANSTLVTTKAPCNMKPVTQTLKSGNIAGSYHVGVALPNMPNLIRCRCAAMDVGY